MRGGKFFVMTIGMTLIGMTALLVTIFLLSPYMSYDIKIDSGNSINFFNLLIFYISLGCFMAGLFSTVFFWLRLKISNDDNLYFLASTSFRQGILMGVFTCIIFLMQSFRVLVWWDALLILGAIFLTEMYLAVRE